jgi:hypothetical protein
MDMPITADPIQYLQGTTSHPSSETSKKRSRERQTGVMCTRERTFPKGDGEKKRIKSSLSSRYLRKEIYIS